MATMTRSVSRFETTAVYTHPEAKVDVVLVHGLNGAPDKTWTAKNGVFWPVDLLPASLKGAHANILVYGYNADVYSRGNDRTASDNFIHQHAQTLVTNLALFRESEGTFKNPIVWVCHSLGGILVKRALLYSNDVRAESNADHRSIYVSTFGIIFLGTPHTGSDGATWGLMLQAMSDAIVPKRFFESESVLLKTLKRDNETLTDINMHFLDIYQRFKIHMAHENHKTDIKGYKTIIVDVKSASPQLPGVTYYGIEATHSGMCKFENPAAPGYRSVSTVIQRWVHDAPDVIQVRWEVEEEERRARTRDQITEMIKPYVNVPNTGSRRPLEDDSLTAIKNRTSPRGLLLDRPESASAAADEPLFIHPERFRPNSSFKGREHELKELHRMLMDPERRDEGTSAVLIWSIPGGGKSHLAREYAFKHRHDYPGGVFWVRAKSPEELDDGFLKIARHSAIRQGIDVEDESDLQEPATAVRLVRDWLNKNEDWLFILDGALSDTPKLSRYIPYARNTSLIITSTDSSIAGRHKFSNPQKLELGPLKEKDAQEMLLEEMDKKKPWSSEDLSRALEVVRMMDCFPVEIHTAAGQLRATKEPLSKYIRSQKSRPRTGRLHAYKAVREKLHERGEMAALNLMYLLSFFNGRLPVELLSLGLKALDKRTPVRTKDSYGKRSLNKTFTVLIVFALIDRDETEDLSSASANSSQETQQNTVPTDPVDVLQIHSFVQNFFIETLKKEGQLEFWLERAAAVFCVSYDEAAARVESSPAVGLPDDYRRYASHCKRILEHLGRIDKPTPDLMAARQALQGRLGDIQGQMATLTRALTWSRNEEDNAPRISVFERTNSWSVSSSTTTADSKDDAKYALPPAFPDPLNDMSSLEFSPHRWHTPYPYDSSIPAPGFVDEDDEGSLAATEMPEAETEPRSPVAQHRTVRRLAEKRYYDRAGAWRETRQNVVEPRVTLTLSNQVALGSFSGSPVAGDFSDAELRLQHIRNASQRASTVGSPRKSQLDLVNKSPSLPSSSRDNSPSLRNVSQGASMSRDGSQHGSHHASQRTMPTMDENPFFEASSPDGIPTSTWRPTSSMSMGNHSDGCIEGDHPSWAPPGLPMVSNSTSSLGPPVSHQQHTRHRVEGATSGSLPESQTGTLQPPAPWHPTLLYPEGYTSQPMSRNPSSSNPELISSRHSSPTGLPIRSPRRAPSMAATEPSPRMDASLPATSYQAFQQRHAGPWESRSRSPLAGGEEMERSGSGGIQFRGKLVRFGQSPPRGEVMEDDIVESPVGLGIIEEQREGRRRVRYGE